jgi:GxxExxY protein
MPVVVDAELVCMSQERFAAVAYDVMNEAFQVQRELGPLFNEKVYQNALMARIENCQKEVRIDVIFQDFCKSYFIDLVVSYGAVFELKAVDRLTSCHHGQLQNYLLLTGLQHGKLINFRPVQVEHKFVNVTLTHADLTNFSINDSEWQSTGGFGKTEKLLIVEMLRDWGTGLSRMLYEEILVHFFGGPEKVLSEVDVCFGHQVVGQQTVNVCAERIAICLTTLEHDADGYRRDICRFLDSSALDIIQWINISRKQVTFLTMI